MALVACGWGGEWGRYHSIFQILHPVTMKSLRITYHHDGLARKSPCYQGRQD